jgi:membrane protein DedA with SNARE-associated domain
VLTESVVLVGLFVPGALVMFGVGVVVVASSLDLWATQA